MIDLTNVTLTERKEYPKKEKKVILEKGQYLSEVVAINIEPNKYGNKFLCFTFNVDGKTEVVRRCLLQTKENPTQSQLKAIEITKQTILAVLKGSNREDLITSNFNPVVEMVMNEVGIGSVVNVKVDVEDGVYNGFPFKRNIIKYVDVVKDELEEAFEI